MHANTCENCSANGRQHLSISERTLQAIEQIETLAAHCLCDTLNQISAPANQDTVARILG